MGSSVVGIDIGNQKSVISVARSGAIDIIVNEVSSRSTPTLVGFGPKSRILGEAAKTQEVSNFRNTISSIKRLIGRRLNDADVKVEQKFLTCGVTEKDGEVAAEVSHCGEKKVFTFTQLFAMHLTKMKLIAEADLKIPVNDVVISCPGWFTNQQRQAMLNASEIAGLHTLRLINDTTAAALAYGITKLDLPETEPRNVVIVDMGHSDCSVSVVAFTKTQLTVLASAYDRHLGGRDLDLALFEHFKTEFKEKFKIDVASNEKAKLSLEEERLRKKAELRLMTAVEKLKKVLSANSSAPINVESLMNDVDVTGMLNREEFEKLIATHVEQLKKVLGEAMNQSKPFLEKIHSVEVIGGSTRVPKIKETISEFFKKTLSFTLNQDEACAKGCGFSCAILSPMFRVRDYAIHDITQYPIEFSWKRCHNIHEEKTSLEVFQHNNPIPSTKVLSFCRSEPFIISGQYCDPKGLPGDINVRLGNYEIKDVKPRNNNELSLVKVKLRLNLHGVLAVEEANIIEKKEIEEPIEQSPAEQVEKKEQGSKEDKDQAMTNTETKTKIRKVVEKIPLSIESSTSAIDSNLIETYKEVEASLFVEDKLVAETEESKNALEEYVYNMRDKLGFLYSDFAEPEKEKLNANLEEAEDWLYKEGEDATKSVYKSKKKELEDLVAPIRQWYEDKKEEERQEILKAQQAEEERRRAEEAAKAKNVEEGTDGAAPLPPPPQEPEIQMQDELD